MRFPHFSVKEAERRLRSQEKRGGCSQVFPKSRKPESEHINGRNHELRGVVHRIVRYREKGIFTLDVCTSLQRRGRTDGAACAEKPQKGSGGIPGGPTAVSRCPFFWFVLLGKVVPTDGKLLEVNTACFCIHLLLNSLLSCVP